LSGTIRVEMELPRGCHGIDYAGFFEPQSTGFYSSCFPFIPFGFSATSYGAERRCELRVLSVVKARILLRQYLVSSEVFSGAKRKAACTLGYGGIYYIVASFRKETEQMG
jgi:hypothetical protein